MLWRVATRAAGLAFNLQRCVMDIETGFEQFREPGAQPVRVRRSLVYHHVRRHGRLSAGDCSREQIVNPYGNAILYTDHFLAQTIRLLQVQTSRDTAMMYLSDHGESLGENNLYLRGVPYPIAPDTRLKVPMTMWFSSGFADSRGIDTRCPQQRADAPASHDNPFSSVLGLMQVLTRDYDPAWDLFAPCTGKTS